MKEKSDLICGKVAVGGNYNSTRDIMTENGDPRFGDIVKTLTLDLSDLENMVTTNTDNFASVKYEGQTKTVHIEVLYQTDASKKTDLVSKSVGTNNWLIDNLKFEEVKEP